MTLAELHAVGFCSELRPITIIREGITHCEEREAWYDPAARGLMREAFSSREPEEEPAPSALLQAG